jgi:cell division protein FtsX
MKWYNGVMSILTLICVGIVLFVLTGCANTQSVRESKDDQALREQVLKIPKGNERDQLLHDTVEKRSYYEEIVRCDKFVSQAKKEVMLEKYNVELESECELVKVQRIKPTPIEVSQEWLDQWPKETEIEQLGDTK